MLLLLAILLVEYLPKPLPASQPPVPPYVRFLKTLPDEGRIIDMVSRPTRALYFQTIHEKPVAFGYVARIPTSVREEERTVKRHVRDKDYRTLFCDYHFKYLVIPIEEEDPRDDPSMSLLYRDSKIAIYDLEAPFPKCAVSSEGPRK